MHVSVSSMHRFKSGEKYQCGLEFHPLEARHISHCGNARSPSQHAFFLVPITGQWMAQFFVSCCLRVSCSFHKCNSIMRWKWKPFACNVVIAHFIYANSFQFYCYAEQRWNVIIIIIIQHAVFVLKNASAWWAAMGIAIDGLIRIANIRPFKWTLHNSQINVAAIRKFNDQTVFTMSSRHPYATKQPTSFDYWAYTYAVSTACAAKQFNFILIVIFMNGLWIHPGRIARCASKM